MSYNSDCFVCCILFLLRISVAQGEYFVSSEDSRWTSEDKRCSFAKPPLEFTEGKVTTHISNLSINKNETIWAGYFRKETGFEYFGCATFGNAEIPQSAGPSENPGVCLTMCKNSEIIGISQKRCFCLKDSFIDNINTRHSVCDKECKYQEGVACGGNDNGISYISLYRLNHNVTHIAGTSPLVACLAQYPNSDGFVWKKCSGNASTSSFQVMCYDGQSVWKANHYDNWLPATVFCFKNNSRPTQYLDSKSEFSPGSPLWTGMIKSRAIYSYDDKYDNRTNIEYGYLEHYKDVNTYELKFRQDDVAQKYLCFTAGPTRQSTSATSRRSTTSSVTTTSEISSAMTTPTTTTSILSSRIDSTEAEVTPSSGTHSTPLTDISAGTEAAVFSEQAGDSRDSEVGAVIGASVVSVLVVIAVVVVVVILKRRKKLPFLCKEAVPAKEFGYQQPKRKIDEISRENHDYDHANVDSTNTVNISSDSNYAHTYFVLEPHVNESNTDNTTYDTSGNANKTITEPDNVYNRLKTDNNQTYDHAHTKIRNGVLKFDDTYDTTDKVAMKLKARPGKDSDAFGETDEDAYNHITSKPVTNTKTENEYGVPNTLENAYGDVGTNNKNNTHDEGDTYSHINKKPQNKEKQGNPFSKSKQIHDSKMSEGNQDADYDVTDRDGKLLTADNDYSTIGTVH